MIAAAPPTHITFDVDGKARLPLRLANRHGLITGPTGTGKTVTLMTMAERFSDAGVPCFIPDIKGDIAALARSAPAIAFDLFGERGVPLRASVADIGPRLLSRALNLSPAQGGILQIAQRYAPAIGLPLDTLADLRAVLAAMLADRREVSASIGLVSTASVGALQRALLTLEDNGGAAFFGAPSFDIESSSMLVGADGRGLVSILAAERLINQPDVYAAFLLWMLSDLFDRLPEAGDLERPRLAFFFDEFHLVLADCPRPLLRRIEQVVRLIRSKGVGVFIVTQSPEDVTRASKPIAEQLATRVEHSGRLGFGRAHVTLLDDSGKRARQMAPVSIALPRCQLGALSDDERARLLLPPNWRPLPLGQGQAPAPVLGHPGALAPLPWPMLVGAGAALGALAVAVLAGKFAYLLAVLAAVAIGARTIGRR
jgi:hypothetical protein